MRALVRGLPVPRAQVKVGRRSALPPNQTVAPAPLGPLLGGESLEAPSFKTDLNVSLAPSGRWVLLRPLVYRSSVLGAVVTVPVGFDTDFASVPRFLPIIFALAGDTSHEAAVVHDYLYRFHQATRRRADAVLFEAMAATREPGWRDWVMWLGVRLGGRGSYRANDALAEGQRA